ncbi:hypothetical protein Tco_0798040 [Tanacetum coccineum]
MVYSFVAKLKSNGVGFDRAFFFVTAIRDEPGIMNYGSVLLIFSAYAPSMPPLLSLLLSMACDDSDGGAVKAVTTRILAGQPFRLVAMAGLYSLTCIVPGISSHFNLNTAHAFAVVVSIATFLFTVMVTRMGYVAMMEYNYGLDLGYQPGGFSGGFRQEFRRLYRLQRNVLDAADREVAAFTHKFQLELDTTRDQGVGQESANKAIGFIQTPLASLATQHCVVFGLSVRETTYTVLTENLVYHCVFRKTSEALNQRVIEQSSRSLDIHGVSFNNNAISKLTFLLFQLFEQKLQKKLMDVCEKERLYHELAYTTKNYDLDVDDKSEASFIVEVVDTIDCQLDLKQVSNPAYLTGIKTYPQVSLLFHVCYLSIIYTKLYSMFTLMYGWNKFSLYDD